MSHVSSKEKCDTVFLTVDFYTHQKVEFTPYFKPHLVLNGFIGF